MHRHLSQTVSPACQALCQDICEEKQAPMGSNQNVTWDQGQENRASVLKSSLVQRVRWWAKPWWGCSCKAGGCWPIEKAGADAAGSWFRGRKSIA